MKLVNWQFQYWHFNKYFIFSHSKAVYSFSLILGTRIGSVKHLKKNSDINIKGF